MEEREVAKKEVEAILRQYPPSEMHESLQYPFGEKPFSNIDPVLTVVENVINEQS